jgi:hypothetical protein
MFDQTSGPNAAPILIVVGLGLAFLPTVIALIRKICGGSIVAVVLLDVSAIGLTVFAAMSSGGGLAVAIIGLPSMAFAMTAWFAALILAGAARSGADRELQREIAENLRAIAATLGHRKIRNEPYIA